MIPPDWVCRSLESIHPRVRLGWRGRERADADELNAGEFMLLELVAARKADRTFRSPWADSGPVYGSDYDRLSLVPMMVYDVSPEDVFSGRVVSLLKRWMSPIQERMDESHHARQKNWREQIHEMAEAAGDELYWKAQRGQTEGAPIVAKKHITPEEKARVNGDWQASVAPEPPPPVAPVAVL